MPHINLQLSDGSIRPFHHRDSSADHGVIEQIFKSQDYSLGRLKRGNELSKVGLELPRPLIIDAGANIGASACWYALNFPNAHVVAYEPDEDNCRFLTLNTTGLNVEVHKAALGSEDGFVNLIDPGQGEWGYQTQASDNGEIPLVSISRVVAEKIAQGYSPFIVKIDIEGGEDNLFSSNCDWLDEFPLIIVELHDWLLAGQGTSRNFLRCMANRDRDFVYLGENIFSIRN